jgi:hypothetical protein
MGLVMVAGHAEGWGIVTVGDGRNRTTAAEAMPSNEIKLNSQSHHPSSYPAFRIEQKVPILWLRLRALDKSSERGGGEGRRREGIFFLLVWTEDSRGKRSPTRFSPISSFASTIYKWLFGWVSVLVGVAAVEGNSIAYQENQQTKRTNTQSTYIH